uniref:Uncharacterized protein n=1 Tax=Amphora coffeiformis TaxID=265554 RepID=A0A7S3L0H5_9STRA
MTGRWMSCNHGKNRVDTSNTPARNTPAGAPALAVLLGAVVGSTCVATTLGDNVVVVVVVDGGASSPSSGMTELSDGDETVGVVATSTTNDSPSRPREYLVR